VAIASLSDRTSRWPEVILTAIFMSVFSVAVFIYGLALNLPVWPAF
jgi:hypothetical protein